MKICVTGANGFIGSHVTDNLRDRGIEVISFDRRLKPFREDVEQIVGDIKDQEAVDHVVYNSDATIHLAGLLGTAETVDTPEGSIEVNILGSLNVFQACRKFDKKCSYITVGNPSWLSTYPITKVAAEKFALMFNKERGARISVVRAMNIYGPRQKARPVRKVIPNFLGWAFNDQPIEIYGDGEQLLDVVYVKDCAELLVRSILGAHNSYDTVFEVGMGESKLVTANTLASLVGKVIGKPTTTTHLPMRAGEPNRSITCGDPKTLLPLNWKVSDFTSLEDGLKETAAWYFDNGF